ncbi:hypothetical protein HBH98_150310 [Parastagonospora nodorum]|nr:hypothetical protein HBH54_013700 [Parastagonospora nodorum]KAH3967631.1 hypothetical protein HBH51_137430 [Parastagonospora nodorum]KAH3990357.1 hypothetical protein HBH52_002630 [Parastagonospora nodorum]KAH4034688.1 hypothetical protein HBI09_102030 [Parastagonospora nodorum]KAH4074614.1 hypothetical protein HBH50_027690 [Parastagonospora nodorum]
MVTLAEPVANSVRMISPQVSARTASPSPPNCSRDGIPAQTQEKDGKFLSKFTLVSSFSIQQGLRSIRNIVREEAQIQFVIFKVFVLVAL